MKLDGIFGGALLALLFASCSSTDTMDTGYTSETEAGTTYLNVRIVNSGDTRADAVYESGSTDEQTVTSANFYFYDKNGHHITDLTQWDGGGSSSTGNVEFKAQSVLKLTAINPSNFPVSLVTVLNAPTTLATPSTLDGWTELLAGGIKNGSNFLMTTSTYKTDETADFYFVTSLKESDFQSTEESAQQSPSVDIYVERLAAKVKSVIGLTANKTNSGVSLYTIPLDATGVTSGNMVVETGNGTSKELYVKFVGWGLNATTTDSYYMKKIDANWTDNALGFAWNSTTNHRSYWCKSYNYGDTEYFYPAKYEDELISATKKLNYKSAKLLTNPFVEDGTTAKAGTNVEYCPENTNTSEILINYYVSPITSVLIKAQIVDETNTVYDYLVRYNGRIMTDEYFKTFALNALYQSNRLPQTLTGGTRNLTASDLKFVNHKDLNGRILLALANDNLEFATGTTVASVNQTLADFNEDNLLIGYSEGLMYYNVPIKHLNEGSVTTDKDNKITAIPEGVYGVVRNHCYNLSIDNLVNIGKGISDPEEPIVPEYDKDGTYYIGATINILSWRTLSQSVTL